MHLSIYLDISIYKLIDKEVYVCQKTNPEMEKPDCKICRTEEEVLHVNVDDDDDVLIRPLGHAFSAQLCV